MLHSFTTRITTLAALSVLAAVPLAAHSQDLRVKCEVRADRSKASVDGRNLAGGQYFASLSSGSNTAATPLQNTIGDQAEFDFSSQPRDIRKGATSIAKDFIVNRQVVGTLYNASGVIVAQQTRQCRMR
jgi:hypothetical protein